MKADFLPERTKFESYGNQHKILGYRHVIHTWLFTAGLISYSLRSIMNVAIVSITGPGNDTNNTEELIDQGDLTNSSANTVGTCPYPEGKVMEIISIYKGEFDWSHATQGFILSCFYYSFMITQIVGGYIVRHTGGRLLMTISIGGSAICILLHPYSARLGPGYLAFVRILHGLADSLCQPVGYYLISRWAPWRERTILTAIAWSGSYIGVIISNFATGFLCEYGFAGGWPSAFYVFGFLGLVVAVGWAICVRDSPAQHPSIRENERMYIEHLNEHVNAKQLPFSKIPWLQLLRSRPFWAIAIAHVCANWAYYTPFVEVPTYLKDILHITPSWTGILTSIPYLLLFICTNLSAFLSDILIAKGLGTGLVRKLCYGLGAIVAAASLALITTVGCSTVAVVALLFSGIGMWGFIQSGFVVNFFDIAPQYASIMFSISSTVATIPAFVIPLVTGYLTNEESSMRTWSRVFLQSAIIPLIGVVGFSVLGSGELQPWAKTIQNQEEDHKCEESGNATQVTMNLLVSNDDKGSA